MGHLGILKSYKIIVQKGKNTWIINGLDPDNTKDIIDTLEEAQKERRGVQLEKKSSYDIQEYILIPKWAIKELIE